jgi:hypothetical protein
MTETAKRKRREKRKAEREHIPSPQIWAVHDSADCDRSPAMEILEEQDDHRHRVAAIRDDLWRYGS